MTTILTYYPHEGICMKLTLLAIGRAHDPMFADAIGDYTTRLNRFVKTHWRVLPAAPVTDHNSTVKQEAEAILKQCPGDAYVVLLDENGTSLTSLSLSEKVDKITTSGSYKEIIWIIGGAYGVDQTVRERANLVWSLSQLTFPHQLVRVLLCEQLYRAYSIRANLPYHHQ